IIGGGIHGVATAYFLAQKGGSVALLERDYCGRCASGVNAGGVRALGRRLAEIPSALASAELWRELEVRRGCDGAFAQTGQLEVAESESDLAALRERRQMLARHGFDHEVLIDTDQVLALVPAIAQHVTGALWVANDGFAFPYKIVLAFADQARKLGVD